MFPTVMLAVVCAAPVPKNLKANDLTAIVGKWELTKATYGGQPNESSNGTKWTLAADGTAVRDRKEGVATAKYALDPTADPKTFDWHTEEGNEFLGAYSLTGDTFRVSLRLKGSKRPKSDADTDDGAYVYEFKRMRD
jgi:uncharacterized protein (TIGR03067 family)